MADDKSIEGVSTLMDAQGKYELALLELVELVQGFEEVAVSLEEAASYSLSRPSWLWTVQRHLERLQAASDGFLQAVHDEGRPVRLLPLAGVPGDAC